MSLLSRNRDIEHWDAEDVAAWDAGNKNIAKRNLIWSIFAEHVGFSVWSIWSVMVLFMPQAVYGIDALGKFVLGAVPIAVGAFMRIPYTIGPAKFGGRNFTIFSALMLAIPCALTMYFMMHPGTSYTTFLIVAAVAGFGGGNFASSMTNINAFYPQRLKGWALGLNAGGGNIGVPVIQIIGLVVIATLGNRRPEVVCAIYLVLLAAAALGAALFMDNIQGQKSNLSAMVEAMKFRNSWVMCFLYIGTFGSFIGFSFAFTQILNINFTAQDVAPLLEKYHVASVAKLPKEAAKELAKANFDASIHTAWIAFLGPLLGSISRPFGGKLADKIGGGKITLYTFTAMTIVTAVLVSTGMWDDATKGAATGAQMAVYITAFMVLFILTGLGNGSTYKMIPSIFEAKAQSKDELSAAEKTLWSRSMSGALIGFAGAVGAFGGVLVNVVLRASYAGPAHSATTAFWVFLAFYVVCGVVTWFVFLRQPHLRAATGEHVGRDFVPAT
ncbi:MULTISPECIES: nitrate/nitrite transporter [unclassified Mycobacterium]|uniref:nitrate/nitrite transporter n=1 Tax=unclassified Mycobacterium TaxID=2642494 RepID=UPI00048D5450|nr:MULTISPECIES: nitrate/nitrite transporter [unclassified Mycobacterium]SEA06053.1 MFS transporter, NNP family, nitrate/nitrite transporter [Mycobacterium sp. 283mftsu]